MKSALSQLVIIGAFCTLMTAPASAATVTLIATDSSMPSTIVNTTACAHPFKTATLSLTASELPNGQEYSRIPGIALLTIDLDAQGQLTSAAIAETSGNPWIDRAAMRSARESIYTPQYTNCKPVASSYFYRIEY